MSTISISIILLNDSHSHAGVVAKNNFTGIVGWSWMHLTLLLLLLLLLFLFLLLWLLLLHLLWGIRDMFSSFYLKNINKYWSWLWNHCVDWNILNFIICLKISIKDYYWKWKSLQQKSICQKETTKKILVIILERYFPKVTLLNCTLGFFTCGDPRKF